MHSCYQMIGPFHFDETDLLFWKSLFFLEMVNLLKRNSSEKIVGRVLFCFFFLRGSTSSYLNESLIFADGRVIILYSG